MGDHCSLVDLLILLCAMDFLVGDRVDFGATNDSGEPGCLCCCPDDRNVLPMPHGTGENAKAVEALQTTVATLKKSILDHRQDIVDTIFKSKTI